MRSQRVYQQAFPTDRILAVLQRNDGKQFDQHLVPAVRAAGRHLSRRATWCASTAARSPWCSRHTPPIPIGACASFTADEVTPGEPNRGRPVGDGGRARQRDSGASRSGDYGIDPLLQPEPRPVRSCHMPRFAFGLPRPGRLYALPWDSMGVSRGGFRRGCSSPSSSISCGPTISSSSTSIGDTASARSSIRAWSSRTRDTRIW